jgi:GNAT superfamily N-acetyltransferase
MLQATLLAPPEKLHVLVAAQGGRVVGALTYADSPDCMAVSGLQARTYLRVYGRRLPAMVRSMVAILRMHPRTPHRHLPMVGVDPGCQGLGIGALLLAEYTRRCDEAGLPGYLETVRYREPGRPSHERLYGRHGFRVEHVTALDPAWSILGMVRPVGGADAAAGQGSEDHRDPAERGILRYFYRDWRPTRLGRIVNRLWGWVAATRLSPTLLQRLEVRGRLSGHVRSVPVVVLGLEGERYLVSMLGPGSAWVRNVEAAGGAAVLRHGRAEPVQLLAVAPDQRAPILREYVRVATSGRKHFPVDPGAPLSEFAAIAERYPAYRVAPA